MKNIKRIAIIAVLILVPVLISLAQPPAPPAPGPGTGPNPGPLACPVGPGVWMLISMGLAYGVAKFRQLRKAITE